MLVGILVDVSGSMKNILQLNATPTDQNMTRIESVFNTIMNIADREGISEDHGNIFVGAFGLLDVATCDLLALLEYAPKLFVAQSNNYGYDDLIRLLQVHGAPFCDKYIRKYLKASEARFFFKFLSENLDKLPGIIERLPDVCKKREPVTKGLLLGNRIPIISYTYACLWREKSSERSGRNDRVCEINYSSALSPRIKTYDQTPNQSVSIHCEFTKRRRWKNVVVNFTTFQYPTVVKHRRVYRTIHLWRYSYV